MGRSGELTEKYRHPGVAERDYEQWLDEHDWSYIPLLRQIHSPVRRGLAYAVLGYFEAGPMEVEAVELLGPERQYGLAGATDRYPGSSLSFLMTAGPPNPDGGYCIVRLS